MGTITTVDELLTRAFELAYFLLGDRTIAIYVAMSAVDNLKIASTAQDRRFDYTPVGRFAYPAIRTKINLSGPHLLQRLIYAESEPFERLLEGQRRSTQEDMIIRFVKHLVRITIRHNSFYLSLGLCRLLYNYTTIETAKFYDFLIQDPDRAKDDYYYRSRKQHLMREMKERFGDSVRTYRGHRGEERFQTQEDSARYISLVQECLRRLTPWQSDCVLPDAFDPHANIIASLLFEGEDPDEEHQVELNRIHTLLHPDCFGQLIANLSLDAPNERLEIPQFFEIGNDQRLSSDRFKPAALDWAEVDSVKRYLERNEGHRKIAAAEFLSLLVDGDVQARFNAYSATGVEFAVKDSAESIELRSFESDEEIPLAIHLLTHGESGILPSAFSVQPKHRQSLSFEIQVEREPSGQTSCSLVRVDPRSVEAVSAAKILQLRLSLQNAVHRISTVWAGGTLLRYAPAILFVMIALAGSLMYFKYSERRSNETPVGEPGHPDHQPAPLSVTPAIPSPNETRPAPTGNIQPRSAERTGNPAVSHPRQLSESTRRPEWVSDPAILLTVKRVYVDPLGEGSMSQRVRQMLVKDLQSSNRFLVVENRDDADAVFKGVAKASVEGKEKASLVLRLVSAEGKVVWPRAGETAGRKYTGTAREVSDSALKKLLSDMTSLEHAR